MDDPDGAARGAGRGGDAAGAWSLQARAVYAERRFRLDDEGARPEGVFEEARLSVMLGVRCQPSRGLVAALLAGLDVRPRFTLEDARGRRGEALEGEPGPVAGLGLRGAGGQGMLPGVTGPRRIAR